LSHFISSEVNSIEALSRARFPRFIRSSSNAYSEYWKCMNAQVNKPAKDSDPA